MRNIQLAITQVLQASFR